MDTIPKIIFIVPYRNRQEQMFFFKQYMNYIMEDYDKSDYKIYFSHQKDTREFNRGGVKNIGFLAMKKKYPDDYKNITFVFNDVDTIPYHKNIVNYQTTRGTIKHFYGFEYALGGFFSITGHDFELLNGFPNFWGWGFEDNSINYRAIHYNIKIDRSNFWHIGNSNIIQLFDSCARSIMVQNKKKYIDDSKKKDFSDGLTTIRNLAYMINDDMIDITSFEGVSEYKPENVTQFNFFKAERKSMFNMRNVNSSLKSETPVKQQKQVTKPQKTNVKNGNVNRRFKMF